jgi:hypothetical protein
MPFAHRFRNEKGQPQDRPFSNLSKRDYAAVPAFAFLTARPHAVSTAFMDSMTFCDICCLCGFWRESIAPTRVDLDAATLDLRGPPEVENLTWARAPSLKLIPEN